jgi:hypothetical protein
MQGRDQRGNRGGQGHTVHSQMLDLPSPENLISLWILHASECGGLQCSDVGVVRRCCRRGRSKVNHGMSCHVTQSWTSTFPLPSAIVHAPGPSIYCHDVSRSLDSTSVTDSSIASASVYTTSMTQASRRWFMVPLFYVVIIEFGLNLLSGLTLHVTYGLSKSRSACVCA